MAAKTAVVIIVESSVGYIVDLTGIWLVYSISQYNFLVNKVSGSLGWSVAIVNSPESGEWLGHLTG